MGIEMFESSSLSSMPLDPPVNLYIVSVEGKPLNQVGSFRTNIATKGARARRCLYLKVPSP